MVQLNVRMPKHLKELIKKYVALDAHKDISEFTREALREKVQRDCPELYRQLFQQKTEEDSSRSVDQEETRKHED